MRRTILFACAAMAAAASSLAAKVFDISQFGAKPDGSDSTPAVIKAIAAAKESGEASTILFPKGKYDFGANFAAEKYVFQSNNDEGLKRVVFLLEDCKNVSIDGGGSDFVFHGKVSPFVVKNSSGITFKNFSVDAPRAFHSEGKIIAAEKDALVLEIPKEYPYEINGKTEILSFVMEPDALASAHKNRLVMPCRYLLEFDSKTRAVVEGGRDFACGSGITAEDLGRRKIRIFHRGIVGRAGNIMAFSMGFRDNPAFAVDNCADIAFDNVAIHTACGMGIICQNSRDITVENCRVTPSANRIVSCTADATHFVNCLGKITLKNNLFENQLDDATNIHGIYERIFSIDGARAATTELVHPQQYGFETFKEGDTAEFVKGASLKTSGEAKIVKTERINKQFRRLTFASDIPAGITAGDSVALLREYPEVLIQGNTIRRNRARGMLLNCRGKTVVENNYFSAPGAALLFEGDACFWFEQGGVRDCVIRGNVFDSCNYANPGWGGAIISVTSGIRADKESSRYNRNIKIENNTFKMFDDSPVLKVYCVDGLVYKNNKIERVNSYAPRKFKAPKRFDISDSDNVEISE